MKLSRTVILLIGKRNITKVLIFGSNGQLGQAIYNHFNNLFDVKGLSKNQCDITDQSNVQKYISNFLPHIVINTAAYTKVDLAEENSQDAININSLGVENIIRSIKDTGILFIHFSTDYVFDGDTTIPYNESCKQNPINSYGMSKYMGERLIQDLYNKYYILRTSWVYDNHNENNFPNKVLRRYLKQKNIQIVDDQKGSPTHVELITDLTQKIIIKHDALSQKEKNSSYGIYHATSSGETSWYSFAKYIIEKYSKYKKLKVNYNNISSCSSGEFETVASRPTNSLLDCSKLEKFLSLKMPTWQYYADKFIQKKL